MVKIKGVIDIVIVIGCPFYGMFFYFVVFVDCNFCGADIFHLFIFNLFIFIFVPSILGISIKSLPRPI